MTLGGGERGGWGLVSGTAEHRVLLGPVRARDPRAPFLVSQVVGGDRDTSQAAGAAKMRGSRAPSLCLLCLDIGAGVFGGDRGVIKWSTWGGGWGGLWGGARIEE